MGNLEKLVVLTVLFLGAILVAWSVTDTADNGGEGPLTNTSLAEGSLPGANPGGPQATEEGGAPAGDLVSMRDASTLPTEEEGLSPQKTTPPSAGLQRPGGGFALDVTTDTEGNDTEEKGTPETVGPVESGAPVGPAAGPRESAPKSEPEVRREESGPVRILTGTNRGLRPSSNELYMVYTVKAGDTWSDLALRFYANTKFTRNLRKDNEDVETLREGLVLAVPIYDDFAGTTRAALAPARASDFARGGATTPPKATSPKAGAPKASGTRPTEVEVAAGDTLSEISMAVYGTSTRWREIFEANRDQLAAADRLKVGMKLRIPAPGTTPVPAPKKKSESGSAASEKPAPKKSSKVN